MDGFVHRVFGDDWGVRSLDGRSPVLSRENRTAIARFTLTMAGGFLVLGLLLLGMLAIAGTEAPGLDIGQAALFAGAGVVVLLPSVWAAFLQLPIGLLHLVPLLGSAMVFAIGVSLGPSFETAVVLALMIVMILCTVVLQQRASMLHFTHLAIAYTLVLVVQDGHPAPVARIIGTMGGSALVAAVIEQLVGRTRELAHAEHEATLAAEVAREELAELNHTLEERVAEQVADLDRLGELERFLPSALVDAVVSGDQSLLEPHRREIAVLFCDLRGFSTFASFTQPEEVHELLDDYFGILGQHAQRHHATVGAFTGDGLMAFFNDPLPVEDPAHRALALALDLHPPVRHLLERWQRVGHEIGFGIGIALGYANIGMIGFEGRRDYTALGPVVNLAARLCDEAPSGGILLDPRAGVAVEGVVALGEPLELHLKGFDRTVAALPVIVPA